MDVQTFKQVKVLVSCVIRYKELQRQFRSSVIKWPTFRTELAVIHRELTDEYGSKEIFYQFLDYLENEKVDAAQN